MAHGGGHFGGMGGARSLGHGAFGAVGARHMGGMRPGMVGRPMVGNRGFIGGRPFFGPRPFYRGWGLGGIFTGLGLGALFGSMWAPFSPWFGGWGMGYGYPGYGGYGYGPGRGIAGLIIGLLVLMIVASICFFGFIFFVSLLSSGGAAGLRYY